MFALFERLLKPTVSPDTPEPPPGLVAFYWHFARQAKPLFVALFVAGFCVALESGSGVTDTTRRLAVYRASTSSGGKLSARA